MVDEIMSRGLLAEMGLPSSIVTSVFTSVGERRGAAGQDLASEREAPDVEPAAQAALLGGLFGALAAAPGALIPRRILEATGTLAVTGPPRVMVERGRDGKRLTLFKPLGQSVALAL